MVYNQPLSIEVMRQRIEEKGGELIEVLDKEHPTKGNVTIRCVCGLLWTSHWQIVSDPGRACPECKKAKLSKANTGKARNPSVFPKTKEERLALGNEMALQKGISIINPEALATLKEMVVYYCPVHDYTGKTYTKSILDSAIKPRCCSYEGLKTSPMPTLIALAASRNHTILTPYPTSFKYQVKLWCNVHNVESSPFIESYIRRPYGIRCCSRAALNAAHDIVARKREANGEIDAKSGQGWRQTGSYTGWRRRVAARPGQTLGPEPHAVHHLYPGSTFPELRFIDSNGIKLSTTLHVIFHSECCEYGKGYPKQLIQFFRQLLNPNSVVLQTRPSLKIGLKLNNNDINEAIKVVLKLEAELKKQFPELDLP